MKYKILLFVFLILTFRQNTKANNLSQDGYRIEVSAPLHKGSTAYFASYWAGKPYINDSTVISEQGIFIFEGNQPLETGQYLIYIKPELLQIELLIDKKEQADIKIQLSDNNIFESMISGSQDTKSYWKYLSYFEEDKKNDNITTGDSDSWFSSFIRTYQPKEADEPYPNPQNNEQATANIIHLRNHYFDHIDFTDERLWRTSFFIPLIDAYLDNWIPQHPDIIAEKSSWIVKQTQGNEFCFENMLSLFVNRSITSTTMGMENTWAKLAEDFIFDKNINWIDSAQHSELKRKYSLIELNRIGMKAQELSLSTIDNSAVNTGNIEADLLLLYFYSPTCSYCINEVEKLRDTFYPKYEDEALKIVAINTDNDTNKWKAFIDQYKIEEWINLIDLNFSSQYWLKYDVSGTPSTYLLNKDKIIIAKKLDSDNLDRYLQSTIKRNKK